MDSFRDILSHWPSLRHAAAEIGRPYEAVKSWSKRDSIPAEADVALVRAANRAGLPLDFGTLARIRAAKVTA